MNPQLCSSYSSDITATVSVWTHTTSTPYVHELSGTKYLLSCISCCTEIFTLTFNLNLWKITHTKFFSTIISSSINTSLESIMLGQGNEEKIWILLLVVWRCTGWLGIMSSIVTPTDMLQSIVTHPAFQLTPDSSN